MVLPQLLIAKEWLAKLPWKWILITASIAGLSWGVYHLGHSRGVSQTTTKYEAAEKVAKDLAESLKRQRELDGISAEKKGRSRDNQNDHPIRPCREEGKSLC